MPYLGKIACLVILCAACGACVSVPAPHLPRGTPQPYPTESPPASPASVPADFPNPARDKRVCKQVDTGQGSKRVCMWEPQH